jgi:hypothetical protein
VTADQTKAEALDGDVLGDDPAIDELPDLDQRGDMGPMSFEDSAALLSDVETRDDEATRVAREEPGIYPDDFDSDHRDALTTADDRTSMILVNEDESGSDQLDNEEQLLGEDVSANGMDIGPEDAAVHIDDRLSTHGRPTEPNSAVLRSSSTLASRESP